MARKRQGIMLAYPFEEKRLLTYQKPYIVQPKYNGFRCRVEIDHSVQLYSSTGLEIMTVPHINNQLSHIKHRVILDGELYIHQQFERMSSIVKRSDLHPDYQDVQLIIFDMVSEDYQEARLEKAKELVNSLDHVKMSSWHLANSIEDIGEILTAYVEQGYEGVIVRHQKTEWVPKRSTQIMKWKPSSYDSYTVVDWCQEYSIHGDPKEALGAFIVKDADGRTFRVGTGMTHSQRVDFWKSRERLPGRTLVVKYHALTSYGVPNPGVFVELV